MAGDIILVDPSWPLQPLISALWLQEEGAYIYSGYKGWRFIRTGFLLCLLIFKRENIRSTQFPAYIQWKFYCLTFYQTSSFEIKRRNTECVQGNRKCTKYDFHHNVKWPSFSENVKSHLVSLLHYFTSCKYPR